MIEFKHKGIDYTIDFHREGTSYHCEVRETESKKMLGSGSSKLGKKDTFTKEKGRYVALTKAVEQAKYWLEADYDLRFAIWKAYNSRSTAPKYNEIWVDSEGKLISKGKNIKLTLKV